MYGQIGCPEVTGLSPQLCVCPYVHLLVVLLSCGHSGEVYPLTEAVYHIDVDLSQCVCTRLLFPDTCLLQVVYSEIEVKWCCCWADHSAETLAKVNLL